MVVLLALLTLLLTLLMLVLKHQHGYWLRRNVPHNQPKFPMGDITEWGKTKAFFEVLSPIYWKFKGTAPFAGIYMGFKPVAVILDIELVKNILIRDFNNFHDRGLFYNEKDDPLGAHLFFLEGRKWRETRQKLTQTFTSGKMKYMYPTIIKVAEELVQVVEEKRKIAGGGGVDGGGDGGGGGVLELTDLLSRFSADVIGSCAFGLECNSLRNPQADFILMGKKSITQSRYPKPFSSLIHIAPKLARALRMRNLPQDVHDFYMGLVVDTMEFREQNEVKRNDFMNILLEMKMKGVLTINEIAAQAFAFLVAGYENSSLLAGFALYELAKQPAMQERLRAEINKVFGQHNNEFTYEAMKDMKYLEQVFSEAMRMYPIFTRLVRQAKADYKIDADARYTIEKGTTIIIPTYNIHHDAEYYAEPAKFDPARFSEAEIKKRRPCTWLPFGDGPRNCIGLRFGKMQVCIGLVYLLRHFKFSVCAQTDKELSFVKGSFFLQSVNGITLRVEMVDGGQ